MARQRYSDVHVALGAEDRALWCMMEPQGRPSFTWPLLDDLARIRDLIDALFMATSPSAARPFDYLVLGSRAPGIFNLGGDLALFAEHIRAGDRTALSEYARACVMAVYANHSGHNHGVVTISLIQGDALGGGLEAALSSDVLVAERQAKLGLPEVLFNLFPGMGAYSFLSRRIGMVKAEEVILSGRLYTAAEMHALGMIDVLAEEGEGEAAVRAYIARHRAHWRAQSTLYGVRRRINPVSLDELIDVTDMWVDAALGMSEQDLRRMTRIAAVQDRSRRTAG
ncbi:MAG: crotonase/enoyl-CoA hydratase family protein [Rhodospirillales bacterium]|nr:crotonase/enoyl-CoA hydratase family protein [Rhodospirillales bacterium]